MINALRQVHNSLQLDFIAWSLRGKKIGFEQVNKSIDNLEAEPKKNQKLIDDLVAEPKKEQVDDDDTNGYCTVLCVL